MHRGAQQLGILVALVSLAVYSWSQTSPYTVPGASVGVDLSSYHQALSKAADMALANVARETEISSQISGSATSRTAQGDATLLHQFAQEYWDNNDEAVRRAVARVTKLRPLLTPILHEEGIPDEIAALVLVESAGQPTALSPKGARGIWQFMPETARRFGLTVNSETDERLDVQKSTRAAARYLRSLHSQFDNWSLALAAYNAGEKVVEKAVVTSGSRDFALLRSRRLIPAETGAYVPAVMAASLLLTGHNVPGRNAAQVHRMPKILFASSAGGDQQ